MSSPLADTIRRRPRRDALFPYLLILPTVVLIAVVMLAPIANVFALSVRDYSFIRFDQQGFVGLSNYARLFTRDPVFLSSLLVTGKWLVCEVGSQLVFGFIVALLLNQRFRGRGFARALCFIPWAVSGILTTILWLLLYNEHIGLLNAALRGLGLLAQNKAWLANPGTVFGSVVVAELWRGIPFFAITLLAALQSIPNDIYESCYVDGFKATQRLVYITLPLLKDSVILTTLLRTIWEFNSVDMIYTMTGGGPMHLTTTLSVYLMQTAIVNTDYGYGSAIGSASFVFLLLFSLLYLALSRYGKENLYG